MAHLQAAGEANPLERSEPYTAACRRCGGPIASLQLPDDVQRMLLQQGLRFGVGRAWLYQHCPTCRRVLRGEAYFRVLGRRFL